MSNILYQMEQHEFLMESVLIGEKPEEYARHVTYLLENDDKAKEIAINGYKFVINNYNWDTVTSELEKLINQRANKLR